MKKLMFIMLLGAVSLVSCEKSEIISKEEVEELKTDSTSVLVEDWVDGGTTTVVIEF